MSDRKQQTTLIKERRQERVNRRRLLEFLGVMVVLVTAYALMMPAISITEDAATQESGFYQVTQEVVQNVTTASDNNIDETGLGQESDGDQATNDDGNGEKANSAGSDNEPVDGDSDESNDDSDADGDASADDTTDDVSVEEKPAQDFHEELKDRYGNVTLTVSVKAPKGAFAAGTAMRISEIDADDIKDEVEAVVRKTSGANTAVKQMTAVDIVFVDADGNEVEPAKQVEVKITSDKVREIDDPVLVHVVDKDKPTQAGKQDDAEVVKKVQVVNEDDADKTVGTEDTLKFKTKEFSPYVIVETVIVENVLASDGNNYKVTVAYGPEAGVPDGARLEVSEILQSEEAADEVTDEASDNYETYLEKTQEALGLESGVFEYARFFNIKIVDENGEKVEIAAPVDVKIELADAQNGEEAEDTTQVVHFADGSENGDVVQATTEAAEAGQAVSFEAEGFSVYAIVKGPSEIPVWWGKAANLNEAITKGLESSGGLYIGHTNGYYLENSTKTTRSGDTARTGIEKTTPAKLVPPVEEEDPTPAVVAAKYYFEQVEGTTNQVYIYCYNGDEKQYVYHGPENNSLSFTGENEKTPFTIAVESGGKFVIYHSTFDAENKETKWYWSMEGGNGGTRVSANNKNDTNSKFYFWYLKGEIGGDPYGLDDNEQYTLITWDGGQTGKALTSEPNQENAGNLCAEFLTVMTKKNNAKQQLFVPNNSKDKVTPWTFSWKHDDVYTLKAVLYTRDDEGNQVEAGTKYLKIGSDGNLSMVDSEADASEIRVVPGTGVHEGQICLKLNGSNTTLTYSGVFAQGFNTNAGTGQEWLYLAKAGDEAQLKDYYRTYSADKISVSDPSLTPLYEGDTKKIIIYTRVWNGSGYSYFAIDGNGKMVPCSESGNEIEWIGSSLDELQWKFTEYGTWTTVYTIDEETGEQVPVLLYDEDGNPIYETDEDGNPVYETDENGELILGDDGQPIRVQKVKQEISPNGYYELQNAYTQQYLAPLVSKNQILSSDTIGLNLNGRSNGQYYTPVFAWDGGNYSYSSIKAELDSAQDAFIEPCVRVEGMDLYFAIINELDVDDTIHTVPTVDNTMYGITMRMANFNTWERGTNCDTSKEQFTVLGNKTYDSTGQTPNLLSTNLDANGYPTALLTNKSLGELYTAKGSGGQADSVGDVNHLFIESTYKATGYYEYDSAQNYAYLKDGTSGDFVVYQEIGTHDSSNKNTLKHGQFFPYNEIKPGVFASTNGRNTYTTTATPLPSTDPRYNEQLYLLQRNTYQPDYPADYWFGAELTASFYQTPSGLDAWGHDIIFEFSGDDDFWLYVDGELVIDLGGIHSALPANVNFRTGKVNVNGTQTTLLDLFVQNKVDRGEYTDRDAAIAALVYDPSDPNDSPDGKKFVKKVVGGEAQYTFIDNTNHTMRIFYMERGAGASNLHMKFNLAAVEKGTVQLSKELDVDGEDMSDSVYATFPYQIWYKDPLYDQENPVHTEKYVQLTEQTLGNHGSVKYLGSTNEVTYKPKIYVDNSYVNDQGQEVKCSVKYEGVYLVDPGETIVITFPIFGETGEEQYVTEYKIVECGVDPNIYCSGEGGTESGVTLDDGTVIEPIKVKTNIRVTGWNYDDEGNPTTPKIEEIEEVYSGLCNYEIEYASLDNRSKVKYKNNVQETEELLIQKNLYKKEGNQISLIQKSDLYYENGDPIDPDNPDLKTTYDFRVSFKTPYDSDYTSANVYPYHVKDAGGYYCKWHPADASSANPNEEGSQGYFERILHNDQGVSNFEDLTDDTVVDGVVTKRGEKSQATFDTSIYGSVSQIPAYYTVELHGLIPGTEFKVVERPTETPDGYEFYRYEIDGTPVYPMTNVSRSDDPVTAENFASRRSSLFVEDTTTAGEKYGGYRPLTDQDSFRPDETYYELDPWLGVEGSITKDKESEVLVDNYKGFALRLYKNWTDAKTMKDRKPAYFAVFYETRNPETGELVRKLVNTDDAVRQLAYKDNPQELYWFYMHLPPVDGMAEGNLNFENYVVREVQLTGVFTVDKHGVVSGYDANHIAVIEDGGVIEIAGTQNIQGAQETDIPYKVTYTKTQTVGTSLRKFWVTDKPSDKPEVKFLKEDWAGQPLAGAKFTLKQGTTNIFKDKASVIEEGSNEALVSTETLIENTDYVLTETFAPQGWYGLQQALTLQLVPDATSAYGWTLSVTPNTGDITDYYEVGYEQVTTTDEQGQVIETDEYIITLTLKNRSYDFKVIKEDAVDHTKLKNVQFELYEWKSLDGQGGAWSTTPMQWDGNSTLTTANGGVIPHLDSSLPPGTYQLREIVNNSSRYSPIGNTNFTVSPTGAITLGDHPNGVSLTGPTAESGDEGNLVYTMTVQNTPKPLKLKKVNESSQPLTGAKFSLSKSDGTKNADGKLIFVDMEEPLTAYNDIDMTSVSEFDLENLPIGYYCLKETVAPGGYIMGQNHYFRIKLDSNNHRTMKLCKDDGSEVSSPFDDATLDSKSGVYIITIKNSPGVPLPVTGGPGTDFMYILGIVLMASAGAYLVMRKKRAR